jgi:hypothetical protein
MSADRVPNDRTSGLTGGPRPRAEASEHAPARSAADVTAPAPDGTSRETADDTAAPSPAGTSGTAPASRPPRLQALAGTTVRGSDDRAVGRVRDIYQRDADGALAAITVMPRQLSARTVLIPAAAIAALPAPEEEREGTRSEEDSAVRLHVPAAAARTGARPPETAHVTPAELRAAAEALGLDSDGSRSERLGPAGPRR